MAVYINASSFIYSGDFRNRLRLLNLLAEHGVCRRDAIMCLSRISCLSLESGAESDAFLTPPSFTPFSLSLCLQHMSQASSHHAVKAPLKLSDDDYDYYLLFIAICGVGRYL